MGNQTTKPKLETAINSYSKVTTIDTSICHSTECTCTIDQYQFDINHCILLRRMTTALQYYQDLKAKDILSNNDEFIYFCKNVYVECLNDYQHIISTHSQHIDAIYEQIIDLFGYCDHSKCQSLTRHYDARRNTTKDLDAQSTFYCEIFDSIHHWMYHLYDCGMRINKNCIEIKVDKNSDDNAYEDDQYIDKIFAEINKEISTKRDKFNVHSDRFGRFNQKADKFKLNVGKLNDYNANISYQPHFEDGGSTFIGALFHNLTISKVSTKTKSKLQRFLTNEEYDTETIIDDVKDHQYGIGSNIINACKPDKHLINSISDYIEERTSYVYNSAFNTSIYYSFFACCGIRNN